MQTSRHDSRFAKAPAMWRKRQQQVFDQYSGFAYLLNISLKSGVPSSGGSSFSVSL